MKALADGKEVVLSHLEKEAVARAGKPGVYRLLEDDSGMLIAVIAGHSFIGTGSYALDGNRFIIVNGLMVNASGPGIQPPK